MCFLHRTQTTAQQHSPLPRSLAGETIDGEGKKNAFYCAAEKRKGCRGCMMEAGLEGAGMINGSESNNWMKCVIFEIL